MSSHSDFPIRMLQNPNTAISGCNRMMVHRVVILFTAVAGPQPSARASAEPRTVQLALELFDCTNARKRGQTWSVCTPCAQAIEDETCQLEIAPALIRRCLVYRTDIAHLRAGARTFGDACRSVFSRLLRSRRGPVS